jgi:cell division protein FtsI/penicillin-binding protein 2
MYNNKKGMNEETNRNNIGNEGISNSTGNNNDRNGKELAKQENPYNLTGKAFENWKLNQEFIAKKSRYITSTNFGDKARTFLFNPDKIESSEIDEGSDGKPYTKIVYTVIEPAIDPKEEKLLSTSSTRLVTKLARWIFEKGRYLLEIQKTGTGFSTNWEVDRAD